MCGGGGGGSNTVSAGPYEKELVSMAERRLAEYNEMYKPLENQYMADTQQLDSDQFRSHMADNAASAARSQFAPYPSTAGAGQATLTNQYANGSRTLAKAASLAAASGTQSGNDMYTGRMLEYAGVGRGQTGMSMNMFGNAAGNQAGYNIASAHSNQMVDSSKYNAFGTAAGMGFGAAAEKYDWFKPAASTTT